ncbi:MAG: beta-propeller domain-containing protein, partial [Pseudomonadota bacterium]
MRKIGAAHWFLAAAIAALPACATTAEDASESGIFSSTLERFKSEAEFGRYLTNLQKARRVAGAVGPADGHVRYATAETDAPVEPCLDIDCPPEGEEQIVVTGSRIPASPSITNVQKQGVDEGDIVKQVGRFLIVLQDGRLFSINIGESAGGLTLADRIDIYASAADDAWYDEIVTHDDLIAVAGYSYDREASEITVFRLDKRGRLTNEGKFFIASDDYYDTDNYATRLVDDKLILYTPIDLYWAARKGEKVKWPVVTRQPGVEKDDERRDEGRALFGATNVYKPVQPALWPVIHAVSVCPLGERSSAALVCETSAIIGPWGHEYYVSNSDAYFWLNADSWETRRYLDQVGGCEAHLKIAPAASLGGALFRLPHSGARAGFMRVSGKPPNQFSLDTSDTEFRALLRDVGGGACADGGFAAGTAYFQAPLSSLGRKGAAAGDANYIKAPDIDVNAVENRFTETHLVYGGRTGYGAYPPDTEEGDQSSPIHIVPIRDPHFIVTLDAAHNIIRLERAGDYVIATGYRNDKGLSVSVIDFLGAPRISGSALLDGRYESEGRSHAFNSAIGEDGAGLIGLPTMTREQDADDWWWRSDASDVSFLAINREGGVADRGALLSSGAEATNDYKCDVSCEDWYGNSRPIFIDGRVFALTGVELIEGASDGGAIKEIRRINLTASAPARLTRPRVRSRFLCNSKTGCDGRPIRLELPNRAGRIGRLEGFRR